VAEGSGRRLLPFFVRSVWVPSRDCEHDLAANVPARSPLMCFAGVGEREGAVDANADRAKARIAVRIDRLAVGNPGDVRAVGDGVSELRIDYGPGYRVYDTRRGALVILLLCGGDKSSQDRDIAQAKRIAAQWTEE
jgi:putative addiction module killer protein